MQESGICITTDVLEMCDRARPGREVLQHEAGVHSIVQDSAEREAKGCLAAVGMEHEHKVFHWWSRRQKPYTQPLKAPKPPPAEAR